MALLFSVMVIVAVLVLGYYLFEKDEKDNNHDEWGGW